MSIATTLQRAAKLHERIVEMRQQLLSLLAQARAEMGDVVAPEIPTALRRAPGRPKQTAKLGRPAKRGRKPKSETSGITAAETPGKRKRGRPSLKSSAAATAAEARPKPGRPRGRRSPLAGRKRASSPSGPLAPAVAKVLDAAHGKPLRVSEILEGLQKDGYQFNATDAKKNLAARIYRLAGVQQVGQGLFGKA